MARRILFPSKDRSSKLTFIHGLQKEVIDQMPPEVVALVEQCPVDRLYAIKGSNVRVVVRGFHPAGYIVVEMLKVHNPSMHSSLHGYALMVSPGDLIEVPLLGTDLVVYEDIGWVNHLH